MQSTTTQSQPSSFLKALGRGQGYLKAGFLGFNKSGKSYTSAKLAIGVRNYFKLTGPVAMFDTEGGSEYLAPMVRKETGQDLLGFASHSLADLLGMAREAEAAGVAALLVDSISHPWRELCSSHLEEVNRRRKAKNQQPRHKLEFQDWAIIKDKWAEWTNFYLNSRLHIIVCGRAGFDYDYETNDETGRKDLVKTGVKMKTEGEFGFEPSLLVEMERVQDLTGDHTKVIHRAVIIGDRFGVIDGAFADDPDFSFFEPHIRMLTPGAHATIDTRNKTTTGYSDEGDGDWMREKRAREIYCEEIQGLMTEKWPSTSAAEKQEKLALLEKVFATRSWTKVSETLDSQTLKAGLETIRGILRPAVVVSETTTAAAETKPAEPETKAEVVATVPATTELAVPAKRRSPRRVSAPDFISPREAELLLAMALRMGWRQEELLRALHDVKGIDGLANIPVDRWEEIYAYIDCGGNPDKEVVLEGMQVR
jgi:hypothetical protein